jgi:hypothetical protein
MMHTAGDFGALAADHNNSATKKGMGVEGLEENRTQIAVHEQI